MKAADRRTVAHPQPAGQQASRFVANQVSQGLLGSSMRSIVGLGPKSHRKREEGEAGTQSQGPTCQVRPRMPHRGRSRR